MEALVGTDVAKKIETGDMAIVPMLSLLWKVYRARHDIVHVKTLSWFTKVFKELGYKIGITIQNKLEGNKTILATVIMRIWYNQKNYKFGQRWQLQVRSPIFHVDVEQDKVSVLSPGMIRAPDGSMTKTSVPKAIRPIYDPILKAAKEEVICTPKPDGFLVSLIVVG
jgi:hypothetical protein